MSKIIKKKIKKNQKLEKNNIKLENKISQTNQNETFIKRKIKNIQKNE